MDRVTTSQDALYERDLHAWCEQQAALLRVQGRPSANGGLDYENLAEEIETLGRSQKNALRSHMVILLLHLLKWRHQPDRRGTSWANSIANARAEIDYALTDSPSLLAVVGESVDRAYPIAVRDTESETGLHRRTFAPTCPFTVAQLLDASFLPEDLAEKP